MNTLEQLGSNIESLLCIVWVDLLLFEYVSLVRRVCAFEIRTR